MIAIEIINQINTALGLSDKSQDDLFKFFCQILNVDNIENNDNNFFDLLQMLQNAVNNEQTTVEQTTVEQTTVEQTTVEQTTVEQTTVEQTTVLSFPKTNNVGLASHNNSYFEQLTECFSKIGYYHGETHVKGINAVSFLLALYKNTTHRPLLDKYVMPNFVGVKVTEIKASRVKIDKDLLNRDGTRLIKRGANHAGDQYYTEYQVTELGFHSYEVKPSLMMRVDPVEVLDQRKPVKVKIKTGGSSKVTEHGSGILSFKVPSQQYHDLRLEIHNNHGYLTYKINGKETRVLAVTILAKNQEFQTKRTATLNDSDQINSIEYEFQYSNLSIVRDHYIAIEAIINSRFLQGLKSTGKHNKAAILRQYEIQDRAIELRELADRWKNKSGLGSKLSHIQKRRLAKRINDSGNPYLLGLLKSLQWLTLYWLCKDKTVIELSKIKRPTIGLLDLSQPKIDQEWLTNEDRINKLVRDHEIKLASASQKPIVTVTIEDSKVTVK